MSKDKTCKWKGISDMNGRVLYYNLPCSKRIIQGSKISIEQYTNCPFCGGVITEVK